MRPLHDLTNQTMNAHLQNVTIIHNPSRHHLAAPVAINQDMKKVVDIMGIDIIDPRTLPVSNFFEN